MTERQRRERAHFNKQSELDQVDLEYFSRPEFGPWNPYWYIYDLVRQRYRGSQQRLLSFGCGRGKNALRYAHIGYEVHGFDISENCVQNAKELANQYDLGDRTHFSAQPAEHLQYPDQFFDVVVGENILHHVSIQEAIREVYRVTRPGGFAVFKEPMATPARDRLRRSAPIRWL